MLMMLAPRFAKSVASISCQGLGYVEGGSGVAVWDQGLGLVAFFRGCCFKIFPGLGRVVEGFTRFCVVRNHELVGLGFGV